MTDPVTKPSHPLRTSLIALALTIAVAFGFAIANRGSGTPHAAAPRPVTIQAALAAFSSGNSDLFLKLDGITGESVVVHHAGEIEINSVQWGVSNPKGSPKAAAFSDLVVSKSFDSASPSLMQATAAATPIPTAKLSVEKPGGTPFLYAELDLEGVRLTSVSDSGAAAGLSESLSVHFSKAKLIFRQQSDTGNVGNVTTGCWNLLTHAAC